MLRAALWTLPFVALIVVVNVFVPGVRNFAHSYADTDFIQYWSALTLYRQHENPYAGEAMLALQRTIRTHSEFPIMMWNPPWLLYLLDLLLPASFDAAALLWLNLNLFVPFGLALWILRRQGRHGMMKRYLLGASALIFLPYFVNIRSGQLGWLLLVGIFLLVSSLRTRSFLAAACGAALLTVKPHIFILVALPIGAFSCRNSVGLTLALFLGAITPPFVTAMLEPGLLQSWRMALQLTTDPSFPTVTQWLPSTLGGYLQSRFPVPHIRLFPAICALLWLFYEGIRNRYKWSLSDISGRLLAISCLTAPYGWISDQLVLLPMWTFTLAAASTRPSFLFAALLLQALPIGVIVAFPHSVYQHQFFWFPLLLLAAERLRRKREIQGQ